MIFSYPVLRQKKSDFLKKKGHVLYFHKKRSCKLDRVSDMTANISAFDVLM